MTIRDVQTDRLVRAVKAVVDRRIEWVRSDSGSRLLWLGMMPEELKEIRTCLEPFRVHGEQAREEK